MEERNRRSYKAEVIGYISEILDMIAINSTRSEILNHIEKKYGLSRTAATKHFETATAKLNDDLNEKVHNIRNRRIHALQKDVKEAYKNYENEEISGIKVKWYNQYQLVKAQLDAFFPNGLKHESERDEMKIEINYREITEKPSEE